MPLSRLHLLTERLSSLFRASLREAASAHGLKLVQLEALIYLSTANRYSNTPGGVTEYLGVTKGTVSQSLKALERRGLIRKQADESDARAVRCEVTPDGQAIVSAVFPTALFVNTGADVGGDRVTAMEDLLRSVQRANGSRTFGQCHTCRFFERRARGGRCGLTLEPLSTADTGKICREHETPATAP